MWFVLSLLVACSLCAIGLLALYQKLPAAGSQAPGKVLILVLALGALAGAFGIAAESEFGLVARIDKRPTLQGARTPPQDGDNDPGLVRQLARNIPPHPRPEAGSAVSLRAWQNNARRQLLEASYQLDDVSDRTHEPVIRNYQESTEGPLTKVSLSVQSSDGTWIPIILFLPESGVPAPAILVIPGHVPAGQSGLQQLTGQDGSYQHSAARRLAEAGFITLALELRGFGALGPPQFPEHEQVAYNAILAGSFYKALIARDVRAALDYLIARPEVDAARLGITGASLGGEIAVAYAALDERIQAIAFHSYGGTAGNFRGAQGDSRPHYCHVIPGSGRLSRQEDVFALLAPRPTLGMRGSAQAFRDPAFEAALRTAWEGLGAGTSLTLQTAPGGHEFFVGPTVEFFRGAFSAPASPLGGPSAVTNAIP